MQRSTKLVLLGILTVVAIAAVVAWSVLPRSKPKVEVSLGPDVKPVPKNAPTLNGADIEKILGMEQFRVIRKFSQVPQVVKESFSNFTSFPFDLANPGEEISSDMIIPGKSSRRLVFLGVNDDSAVLFYKQGGFVGVFNAVVFSFGEGGRDWGATLERGPIPKDISGLRAAVQNGKFHVWESRQ
jgi:hypothetical protein